MSDPSPPHFESDILLVRAIPVRLRTCLPQVALLVAITTVWFLARPYAGLDHDSILYSLLALAQLNPSIYAEDLFVRFGSQGELTLFTPIFTVAMQWLGLPAAAAVLTCVSLVVFLASSAAFAARIMPREMALFAAGTALIIPCWYGGFEVFEVVELFLTPRLLAESCILLAFAMHLRHRRWLSYACCLLGLAMHPLMAFPGLLVIAWSNMRDPHRWTLSLIGGLAGIAIAYAIAVTHPLGALRLIDGDWLEIVLARSPYLFIDTWPIADLQRAAASIAVSMLAWKLIRDPTLKDLFAAVAFIAIAGISLTAVTSWGPKIQLLIAGQPWRWGWPAALCSVIVLPFIISCLWRDGKMGQGIALLVVLAVLRPAEIGLLAVLSYAVWSYREKIPTSSAHLVWFGAVVITGAVVALSIADIITMSRMDFATGQLPFIATKLRNIFGLGLPGWLALGFVWYSVAHRQSAIGALLLTAGGVWILGSSLPQAWQDWTRDPFTYSAENQARLKPWRDAIPESAEVFWNGSPLPVWLLLERRSYMSVSQSAGVVFSRETALEVSRRADVVDPLIERDFMLTKSMSDDSIKKLTPTILHEICRDPILSFVVGEPGAGPGLPLPPGRQPWEPLQLYSCEQARLHPLVEDTK